MVRVREGLRASRRTAILSIVISLIGCAALGPLNPPRRLLEQARAAVAERDLETAYAHLAKIRTRYPDSPESREGFPLAASIFQRGYLRSRHAEPTSHWVTGVPEFMLDWFASFFESSEFPQTQAEALFVGMHHGYFREYLAYAAMRPDLSRWVVRVEDDNGIIESIAAEPRERELRDPSRRGLP